MAPPPPPLRYTRRSSVVLVSPAGCGTALAQSPPPRVALSRLDVNNVVLTAHAALFYAEAIDESALRASLAAALASFPPLAGRVAAAPRAEAAARAATGLAALDIVCNGAGVAFDVFSCDGRVADFDASQDERALGAHTQPQSNSAPPVRAIAQLPAICKRGLRCRARMQASQVRHFSCSQALTSRAMRCQAFIPPLSPLAVRLGTSPLLSARLTRLACGGCVVGISVAHLVMDGMAAAAFLGAWAQAHACIIAGRMPPAPPAAAAPEFSRAALLAAVTAASQPDAAAPHAASSDLAAAVTARGAARRLAKLGWDFATRRTVTVTVRVPAAAAAAARARAEAASGERLSSNDVAMGLAWALLRRTRSRGAAGEPRLRSCAKDNDQPTQFMTQAADLRRLLPALPAVYCGNAVAALLVAAPADAAACPLRAAAASAAALRVAREDTSAIAAQLRAALALPPNGNAAASADRGGDDSSSFSLPLSSPFLSAAKSAELLPHFGDGMFSSWYLPALWRLRFGGGAPRWSYVAVFPAAPWTFGAMAGPPDAAGASDLLLLCNCPATRAEGMRREAQRLLRRAAGGDDVAPAAAA